MTYSTTKKKLHGIWGLGISGSSILRYLHQQGYKLAVIDRQTPSAEELSFFNSQGIVFFPHEQLPLFLDTCTYIIPSPGIDLRPYKAYSHKWISELDIFSRAWHKKIIAITGTIGKTSIVHLMNTILTHAQLNVATGGNIGTGMLDLLSRETGTDYALLELSSFQLDISREFSPDLAIITNIFPNHIDRHGSEEEYLNAKLRMCVNQKKEQKTLVPWRLRANLPQHLSCHFFSSHPLTPHELEELTHYPDSLLYYKNGLALRKIEKGINTPLINTSDLPALSYPENWLVIVAALDLLTIRPEVIQKIQSGDAPLTLPAHRLAPLATIKGVTFYNDSKSTIMHATLAAVDSLADAPLHLFLGGISKGVNRLPFLPKLINKVKTIHCFGAEAEELSRESTQLGLCACAHKTLEEAFEHCLTQVHEGDRVLFSPAGASFDLFKDYQERGNRFIELVHACAPKE